MKNIIKILLCMAIAVIAKSSFAQDTEDTPVYSGIHYYSERIKKDNNEDTAFFNLRLSQNDFDSCEVQEIFSSKFTEVDNYLEQINKTLVIKQKGMVVVDEYGRKIYFPISSLKNDHILLEGGETINGIFFPNVISPNGVSCKEDENKPGWFIPVPKVIYYKVF